MSNKLKQELDSLKLYVDILNLSCNFLIPSNKDKEIKEEAITLIELSLKEIKNLIL